MEYGGRLAGIHTRVGLDWFCFFFCLDLDLDFKKLVIYKICFSYVNFRHGQLLRRCV